MVSGTCVHKLYNTLLVCVVSFLGTSGESIDDIGRCTQHPDDPIHIVQSTLEWNHLAPTVPDTLGVFVGVACMVTMVTCCRVLSIS